MYSDNLSEQKFGNSNSESDRFVTTSIAWTVDDRNHGDASNIDLDKSGGHSDSTDPTTINTVAAVVSALLATTFLLLLVFIIRAIRKRRQERLGNRFGVPIVHTIAPSSFGANVAAYRNVPIAGGMSWESVTTPSAPVLNIDPI